MMARSYAVRAGMLLAAFAAAGATSASSQVVTGRVTAAPDGTPLSGVAVTLFDSAHSVAGVVRTDSTGSFRLLAPSQGLYRIYVVHSGFAHFVTREWMRFRGPADLRLDIDLHPASTAQALPSVLIAAERESLRKRRVQGRDLRAVPGEIITRSEVAMIAEDASSVYDIVRTRRITALRLRADLCLAPLQAGPRRGMWSMRDPFGNVPLAFAATDDTGHCLPVHVDEVVWARPGDPVDAYFAVAGHIKPDDIDWMFVERASGAPVALHIYTKSFVNYAQK